MAMPQFIDGNLSEKEVSAQASGLTYFKDEPYTQHLELEIHPLLRRSETFGLLLHLFRSNRAERTRSRGTQKQRTYESGLTEVQVVSGMDRDIRTDILFF